MQSKHRTAPCSSIMASPSSNNTNDAHEEKAVRPSLTLSQRQQLQTEDECAPFFVDLTTLPASQLEHLRETGLLSLDGDHIQLLPSQHRDYLHSIAEHPLHASFVSLDSSRPWMMYWCWHACDLLNQSPDVRVQERTVTSLRDCFTSCTVQLPRTLVEQDAQLQKLWNTEQQQQQQQDTPRGPENYTSRNMRTFTNAGGFGGGVDQMPHAATTYAAVLCLCLLSVPSAVQLLEEIRWQLYPWLWSLLVDGSDDDDEDKGRFRMHQDGELDVRATYCVLVVAKLLNIWPDHWWRTTTTPTTVLATPSDVANAVCRCQTWEGGLAGEPGGEAHGGYTYCGVAALYLLDSLHQLDLDSLLGWLSRRQMTYEGGYSGRSNKLVDGCYSFWQGAAVVLTSWSVQEQQQQKSDKVNNLPTEPRQPKDPWLVASKETDTTTATPKSALFNAAPLERYILLCCQDVNGGLRDKPSKGRDFYHSCYCLSGLAMAQQHATDPHYPSPNCHLPRTHPVYNLRVEHVVRILRHFESLDDEDHQDKTSLTAVE